MISEFAGPLLLILFPIFLSISYRLTKSPIQKYHLFLLLVPGIFLVWIAFHVETWLYYEVDELYFRIFLAATVEEVLKISAFFILYHRVPDNLSLVEISMSFALFESITFSLYSELPILELAMRRMVPCILHFVLAFLTIRILLSENEENYRYLVLIPVIHALYNISLIYLLSPFY